MAVGICWHADPDVCGNNTVCFVTNKLISHEPLFWGSFGANLIAGLLILPREGQNSGTPTMSTSAAQVGLSSVCLGGCLWSWGNTPQTSVLCGKGESCPNSDIFQTEAVLGNHLLSCDFSRTFSTSASICCSLVHFHLPRHQHM